MFYYKNWDNLCGRVSELNNVNFVSAKSVLKEKLSGQFVIFKHDIETNPIRALELAKIENSHGISGSFYAQAYLLDNPKNVNILKQIEELGHEVSYHYDVLDANNGNMKRADNEFERNCGIFKTCGFNIETVCQHGNPVMVRKGYTSNRDFFRNLNIRTKYFPMSDIMVDFKERLGMQYSYISDAGYGWKIISDPENNDRSTYNEDKSVADFNVLFEEVKKGSSLIISTHPHRWRKTKIAIESRIIIFKGLRLVIQGIRKIPFVEVILSRFYFIAKRI